MAWWPYFGSMEGWESINLRCNHCWHIFCIIYKVSPVSPGQAAEAAADKKKVKYSIVSTNHWFIPVAVETMVSINQEGSTLLDEVGNRITEIAEDPESREHTFFNQRLSVIILRFNSIAFRGTFIDLKFSRHIYIQMKKQNTVNTK